MTVREEDLRHDVTTAGRFVHYRLVHIPTGHSGEAKGTSHILTRREALRKLLDAMAEDDEPEPAA